MPKKNNPGCGCCTLPCTYTVTVKGCNALVVGAGATVSLDDGAGNVYSATTDSGGVAAVGYPGAGTYTRTVSLAPRFATAAASVTIGCGASAIVTLSPDTGYVCMSGSAASCALPISRTLQFTDPNGTYTATYDATIPGFVTCYARSGITGATNTATCVQTAGLTVPVEHSFVTNGTPSYRLQYKARQVGSGCTTLPVAGLCSDVPLFPSSSGLQVLTSPSVLCPPVNFTATIGGSGFPNSSSGLAAGLWGEVLPAGSVTVTEL